MEDLEAAKLSHRRTTHEHHDHRDDEDPKHHHLEPPFTLRQQILRFSPQWFTLTMGSGITAILLHQFPYPSSWLYWLSVVVFGLHALLVPLFTVLSVTRFIMYPELWRAMVQHPVEICYLGAFPVSLLSLANMISLVCAPAWGRWAAYTAWILWVIASVLAVLVATYVPWSLVRSHFSPALQQKPCTKQKKQQTHDDEQQQQQQQHQQQQSLQAIKQITAVYLLPPISAIVASTTAAAVSQPLPSPYRAAATALTGYILLGLGLSTALFIMVLYLLRLLLIKLPAREMVVSGFIPIGPLNMGAAGCVMLGVVAKEVFPKAGPGGVDRGLFSADAAEVLHAVGVLMGVVLWAFSLLWLWFAVGGLWVYAVEGWLRTTTKWGTPHPHSRHNGNGNGDGRDDNAKPVWGVDVGFPFNLSWWSFIFPLGTMALSSGRIAEELPSTFFRVVAAALSALVAVLFLAVGVLTVLDLVTNQGRKVLKSPALDALENMNRIKKNTSGRDCEAGNGGDASAGGEEDDEQRHEEDEEDAEESTLKGVDSAEENEGRRRRTRGSLSI